MARWGEGDPRWIVEERPDATNVNNWHWTEKNATDWSKEKLNALFLSIRYEDPNKGSFLVSEIKKCDGEATANNRKGKLIFFYEFVVELEWQATSTANSDNKIKGKVEILNLSEENEPHEVDMEVTLLSGGEEGDIFKEIVRTKGQQLIRDKIALYIQALKDEYACDLLLPTKNQSVTKQNKTVISADLASNVKNMKNSVLMDTSAESLGVKFQTSTIESSEKFKCTADELYKVLTTTEMVSAFTRNDVKLECEKGGKFELFGGNISGEFVELIPDKKIVQSWRFKTWPQNHFSQVTLTIVQKEDFTKVQLKQTGIPSNDIERTKAGWNNYYWESIKRTFGFGATLL